MIGFKKLSTTLNLLYQTPQTKSSNSKRPPASTPPRSSWTPRVRSRLRLPPRWKPLSSPRNSRQEWSSNRRTKLISSLTSLNLLLKIMIYSQASRSSTRRKSWKSRRSRKNPPKMSTLSRDKAVPSKRMKMRIQATRAMESLEWSQH